ncbi:MAG TPA: CsbD family protein [Pseudonocardiaceae bacterium]|nr:CsbD family protein [Pseudonocardiaceae bacterium]
MANEDKIKHKIDEGAGRVKETMGNVTGDEELRQEGEFEKDKAQLKDKVADAVDKAKDIFRK